MSVEKLSRLKQLAAKARQELRDPAQLLDPQRVITLAKRGTRSLLAAGINPADLPPMDPDLVKVLEDSRGITWYLTEQTRLAGAVFPVGSKIFYERPERADFQGRRTLFEAYITSTTVQMGMEGLPDQGYKDSYGERLALERRVKKDWIQHGGFLVDNASGSIEFFDYASLERRWELDVKEPEVLVQANWRVALEDAAAVVSRDNMILAHPYNAIGLMTYPEGSSALFTVNSEPESLKVIRRRNDLRPPHPVKRDVFMKEMVEFADIIAGTEGAIRWEMMGLEYTTGGTYFKRPAGGDHFGIKLP